MYRMQGPIQGFRVFDEKEWKQKHTKGKTAKTKLHLRLFFTPIGGKVQIAPQGIKCTNLYPHIDICKVKGAKVQMCTFMYNFAPPRVQICTFKYNYERCKGANVHLYSYRAGRFLKCSILLKSEVCPVFLLLYLSSTALKLISVNRKVVRKLIFYPLITN